MKNRNIETHGRQLADWARAFEKLSLLCQDLSSYNFQAKYTGGMEFELEAAE